MFPSQAHQGPSKKHGFKAFFSSNSASSSSIQPDTSVGVTSENHGFKNTIRDLFRSNSRPKSSLTGPAAAPLLDSQSSEIVGNSNTGLELPTTSNTPFSTPTSDARTPEDNINKPNIKFLPPPDHKQSSKTLSLLWHGFEQLLKRIQPCLDGTPAKAPITVLNTIIDIGKAVGSSYVQIRSFGNISKPSQLAGIIEGAAEGRGRGKQVIAVARTCHLIFIVLDVLKPLGDKKIIETELEGFGIRLNKKPPNVTVRRKEKGGIAITNTVPLTNIDHDEIKAILSEYRINNVDIAIREPNATADDLVDVIEGNRVYIPAIYVLNKIDAISIEELDLLYKIPMSVPISSREWWNVDELLENMWGTLSLVRVYTKPRGQAPDYSAPVVLKRGRCTVEDFCNAIHKEIAKQMKYAIVWGAGAKHSRGQKVGLEHVLEDEDVVNISKK